MVEEGVVAARMMDWRTEYTFEGMFWLPSASSVRVPGRLMLKAGSWPVLHTMSPLLPANVEQIDHLLGATGAGEVSLLSCALLSSDMPLGPPDFRRQAIGC